jgi:hypothetical protein
VALLLSELVADPMTIESRNDFAMARARIGSSFQPAQKYHPTTSRPGDRTRLLPDRVRPAGVRLTAYGGDVTDLPTQILQDFLDAVAAGDAIVPIHTTYRLHQIAEAHADMVAGRDTGNSSYCPDQSRRPTTTPVVGRSGIVNCARLRASRVWWPGCLLRAWS